MRFAILGWALSAGTLAKLARAGHDVTVVARGEHLQAIVSRGLLIRSPALGDFVIHAPAIDDASLVGSVDVVVLAVKASPSTSVAFTDR